MKKSILKLFRCQFVSVFLILSSLLLQMVGFSQSQTLNVKLIIDNRLDLTVIDGSKFLPNTDVMTYMANAEERGMVFFAPHNSVFDSMSPYLKNQLNLASKETMNNIFSYHLVPGSSQAWTPESTSEGNQTKLLTRYGGTNLFITRINGVLFVNGARIIVPSLHAANGDVHIVNQMFVSLGPAINAFTNNAFDYIKGNLNLGMASELLSNFRSYQSQNTVARNVKFGMVIDAYVAKSDSFCTIFVPNDSFLRKFSFNYKDLYTQIKGASPAIMKQTMESLIIPGKAYHLSLLEELTTNKTIIEAATGQIRVYRINGIAYVSNQCGQASIMNENIITANCIVHVIDNFLNLISNDIFTLITTLSDTQEFSRSLVRAEGSDLVQKLKLIGGPEYTVPDSEKYTLFAPTNGVFYYVDLSYDASTLLNQLSQMIVPGILDLSMVTGQIKVDTLRPGYKATVTRLGQDIYVEVDHVAAKLVQANICTRNGIIHTVDRIVGVRDSHIYSYLDRTNHPRLAGILQDTGLRTVCINPTVMVTLFAPVELAISNISQAYLGQQNRNKLLSLMSKHLGKNVLYTDSIPDGGQFVLETYNGANVVVSNSGRDYWVSDGQQRVKIVLGNLGMTNGVIHFVDNFLPYSPMVSSATPTTAGVMTTIFLLFSLVCFRTAESLN